MPYTASYSGTYFASYFGTQASVRILPEFSPCKEDRTWDGGRVVPTYLPGTLPSSSWRKKECH